MKPLQASSGDLLADRRADYAEMLFASGEQAAAAELLLGALNLAPGWVLGWYRLGEMHEASGLPEEAAGAWTTALRLDPADRPGATLKLAHMGRAPRDPTPPIAFIEAMFDQYADRFDASLVGKLGYRAPEFLAAAILAQGARRFRLALDLGCGTGLMGERLRPFVDRLEGLDISSAMLREARGKGVYDRLEQADLQHFSYPIAADGRKPDLVTAADVFMYAGGLDGIFACVAGLLAADGLFAFSVEKLSGDDGFGLQSSRRYTHSEAYVRRMLDAAGLSVLSLEEKTIRRDRNEPVEGLIAVAGFAAS